MSNPRLSMALEAADLVLPETGTVAVLHPTRDSDISDLPRDRALIVQPFKPDHDAYAQAGYATAVSAPNDVAANIIYVPRSKQLARGLIAQASATGGLVIVDGQKTDGIESIYKDCRKRADILGTLSKAHGKLFWFQGGDFADWTLSEAIETDGFTTRPGVFSADGIDPASKALAASLPDTLGKYVADLGAGWGYLSREILKRQDIETLYMVEADHTAVICARENVTDPRANIHWADATTWEPRAKMNSVVMNPPFHTGRKADPDLGRAFIQAAAAMISPNGQLLMVANRHLPYETTLQALFAKVEEIAGDNRFKILRAERPARAKR